MYAPRDRWPTFAGLGLSLAVVAVAGTAGWGRPLDGASAFGIRFEVWAAGLTLLALFLALQIFINGRTSLLRERRLVHTAAALREAHAELERLATLDPLTGVLNRRAFFERMGLEFRRSQRYGRPMSLVMVDLDDFKPLNDAYGHPFGDFVLAETAKLLRHNVRESDVLARYGGEEFVLLLPETPREAARVVAQKLCEVVAAHEFRADATPRAGAPPARTALSAGVAALPVDGPVTSEELLERADRALYAAKRAGKNRVAVDGEGETKARRAS